MKEVIFTKEPIAEDEENWNTVIDFTAIKNGGVEINELIEALDFRLKQI